MSPTLLKVTHANAASDCESKGRLSMYFRFQARFEEDNRAGKYFSLVSPRNRQLKGTRIIVSEKCWGQDPNTEEGKQVILTGFI